MAHGSNIGANGGEPCGSRASTSRNGSRLSRIASPTPSGHSRPASSSSDCRADESGALMTIPWLPRSAPKSSMFWARRCSIGLPRYGVGRTSRNQYR